MPESPDDPYVTLGVERSTGARELRTAYRQLALQFHPDRQNGDTAKFRAIVDAYAILSDSQRRQEYDLQSAPAHAVKTPAPRTARVRRRKNIVSDLKRRTALNRAIRSREEMAVLREIMIKSLVIALVWLSPVIVMLLIASTWVYRRCDHGTWICGPFSWLWLSGRLN